MKLISIVTPCFNEEENVARVFERVRAALEPFRGKYDYEHIFTDNCSQDTTFEILTRLGAEHPNVRALRFSRNIGADRAIYMALQHARGHAAIIIQADLQDPPELIPDFINGWEEGYDVVYGEITRRTEGAVLQALRRLYYRIIAKLSEFPIPENAGEFRLMDRRVLDALSRYEEYSLYLRGIVAHIGFRQKAVPYTRAARLAGTSSVSMLGLVTYAINGLFTTSVAPIRAVSIAGGLISLLGLSLTLFYVVSKLFFSSAPHGFTTLASLITFFAGAQLLSIGIIGEYVRKIYVESIRRPRGFVQDKVNLE